MADIITSLVLLQIFLSAFMLLFMIQTIIFMLGTLKKPRELPEDAILAKEPVVTVQLPLFNEKRLVKKLVEGVTRIDYPQSKIQIQILDDSTDDTINVSKKVADIYKKKGWDIEVIHRTDRKGYKAGALNNGLKSAKGDFVAVFDADFTPPHDFLKKTLPYFGDSKIGFVKTSIEITNKDGIIPRLFDSMVVMATQLEQVGRDRLGLYQSVSGSSFIIRKSAIVDSGGWSYDTLVEDLDLSFVMYARGWKSAYLPEIQSRCEAPTTLKALWIQQFRWGKGTIQCLVKHWKSITSSEKLSFFEKIMALYSGYLHIPFIVSAISFVVGIVIYASVIFNPSGMNPIFYTFFAISTPVFSIFPVIMFILLYRRGFGAIRSAYCLICMTILLYVIAIPIIKGNLSAFSGAKNVFVTTPKE